MKFLFENFDILAQAPGGVKKLREMILQFAVRGKLVKQDPNDEPASVLLEKIKAEKERLVRGGKIKEQKPLEPIRDDEIPFDLPKGWKWCRLDNICMWITQGPNPKYDADLNEHYSVLKTKDFYDDRILYNNFTKISKQNYDDFKKYELQENDIVYGLVGKGSTAKCNIFQKQENTKTIFTRATGLMRLIDTGSILPIFIKTFFVSNIGKKTSESITDGSTGQLVIKTSELKKVVLGCPPLSEQKRIVAKVDSLMELCDVLEKQQQEKAEKKLTLNKASLHALNNSNTKQDFDKNWNHITKNFDLFYSTDENVNDLKQTILQLAVQGKLVPQNPDDEPASVLLEKIKAEKERLVKEGKIKKQKLLEPIREDEIPFDLPKGWEWTRLGAIANLITKGSSPKWQGIQYTDSNKGILFITSENVGTYNLLLNKKKYVEKEFNKIEPRSILRKNDFLMNIVGASIGRVALYNIDETANINQAVCLIRMVKNGPANNMLFLLYFLNSETCISYMYNKQVDNARANLSMGNINKFIIPIPPLAEQKRIVAKVDSLMALCDKLSKSLTDKETKSEKMLNAVVNQL